MSNQRGTVLNSLFIVLQSHSTYFGCPLHPSSGVHKTVATTTGTSHACRWQRSKSVKKYPQVGQLPHFGHAKVR